MSAHRPPSAGGRFFCRVVSDLPSGQGPELGRPGAVNGATWFAGTGLAAGGNPDLLGDLQFGGWWEQREPDRCKSLLFVPAFYIAAGEAPPEQRLCADVNDDGTLNGADFNAWLAAFAAVSQLADQNSDGLLNGSDFNAWLGNFSAGSNGPTCQ